jgi:glycosyltransferase involved in cell wall biosynthesis
MFDQTLSVVMPNYNHGHFLKSAVEEILGQSFPPCEIIIIDDGSTDDSVKVIEFIARENPSVNIKFIRNEQNQGVIYTANRGLEIASGEYIYFAAADDILYDNFFDLSMRLLAKYPQAGLCSSMGKSIYPDGSSVETPLKNPSPVECYITPLECMSFLRKYDSWMGGNSNIFRRDVVLECGGLIQNLGASCDIFLGMLAALKHGVCFIPKQLVGFRLTPNSYSANFNSHANRHLNLYSSMADLMRTTHADLFPVDYVNSWERRMMYRSGVSLINQMYNNQINVIHDIISKKNLLDKVFFLCIKLGMRIQLMILIFYYLLRLDSDFRIVMQRGILIKIKRLKSRFFLKN